MASREIHRSSYFQQWKISKFFSCVQVILGVLAILLCLTSLVKLYSSGFFWSNEHTCKRLYVNQGEGTMAGDAAASEMALKLKEVKALVDEMQAKVEKALAEWHEKVGPKDLQSECMKYSRLLADVLTPIDSISQFLHQLRIPGAVIETAEEEEEENNSATSTRETGIDVEELFHIEEMRKYVSMKQNRLGKQNFMGANATFSSIGHGCLLLKEEVEEYMGYDIGDYCNDDWNVAQRLMVHGCDPLPRRRCFARAPRFYQRPLPINESLWRLPDDRNVRWSNYMCKNFTCLANNATVRKGFFKCSDCFNLMGYEWPRWMQIQDNATHEFLMSDVLGIKPGEIRIGLDFSVGTGTFAARMREFNVTVVSATINLGAPFSEMIALRGLVPLYLTVNQRLPFFDNTLDLIHTTRFLDSWIDLQLLDYVIFDWDRVLRPGGLLWIDAFFCAKRDLEAYLHIFLQLRYKKHKWTVAPKLDKSAEEVYFSAVLEKPPRPF